MTNGMPSWEEWNEQLSEDQRKYRLYTVLDNLLKQECGRVIFCEDRAKICLAKFESIDKRKTWDTGFSGVMGIIGGAIVWGVKWLAGK